VILVSTAQATPVSDRIAAKALQLREQKKLTRATVATAMGISTASLRNFEDRRRRDIGVDELVALAAALGCSPESLGGPAIDSDAPVWAAANPSIGVPGGGTASARALTAAVREDIAAFGDLVDLEPSLAEAAYVLAAAIDDPFAEPKTLPALVKELRAVLDDIRNGRSQTGGDDDLAGMDTPD